jgi:ABC-type tungstate transport system substrate-binding protein
MLVRVYIYCHIAAAALTGLASYWDRHGVPTSPIRYLYDVGIAAVYSLPILLGCLLYILLSRKIDGRNKVFALIAGSLATIGQIFAMMPLIQ